MPENPVFPYNVREVTVAFGGTNPATVDIGGGTIIGVEAETGSASTALTVAKYSDFTGGYVELSDGTADRTLTILADKIVTLTNVTPFVGLGRIQLTQDTPEAKSVVLHVADVAGA